MTNLAKEIQQLLKVKYEEIRLNLNFQKDYEFYVKDLDENLFEPMSEKTIAEYTKGRGKELEQKMLALRSSSAMTYNLLGNGNVTFQNKTFNKKFEYQSHTLQASTRPANLDALLTSSTGEEIIACEMKMMEWIGYSTHTISKAYFDISRYFDKDSASNFTNVLKHLIEDSDNQSLDSYKSKYSCYDALQMFKHTLALYNACYKKELNPTKLTLLNVVGGFPTPESLEQPIRNEYETIHTKHTEEFNDFYSKIIYIKDLFKKLYVDFDIKLVSVSNFINSLTISKEHKEYLKRYTF